EQCCQTRRDHPRGGSAMIRLELQAQHAALPCARTIRRHLRQAGLPAAPPGRPPARSPRVARAPHQRWQIDAAKLVLPELVKQGIGVLGMKPMANGIILRSGTVTPVECLHYALNLPTSVVITGVDSMEILDQAFEAVRTFRPLTESDVQALLAKSAG